MPVSIAFTLKAKQRKKTSNKKGSYIALRYVPEEENRWRSMEGFLYSRALSFHAVLDSVKGLYYVLLSIIYPLKGGVRSRRKHIFVQVFQQHL